MLERFHVSPEDQVRVSEEALRRTVTDIFLAMGAPQEDAEQGADVLVYADVHGVETHGVSNMLRTYVLQYQQGLLNPTPTIEVVSEFPAGAVLDGDRGLGAIQAPKAMRVAIERARETGVGVVVIRNIGHTGAVGYHAQLAADEGMVGLSMTAAGSQVLPTFAGEPRMGTNPISIAAPTGERPRFIFDAAMSAIAGNKIGLARRVGAMMHPGWVSSWNGTPIMEDSSAPAPGTFHQLPLGSTREMGSHKGFGLALMVEVLATMLSGSVPRMVDPQVGSRHFLAAFDISRFGDLDQFTASMDQMLGVLVDTPPAPGQERVIYPGVAEQEARDERLAHGIPLHREVIDWFDATTEELGIEPLATL